MFVGGARSLCFGEAWSETCEYHGGCCHTPSKLHAPPAHGAVRSAQSRKVPLAGTFPPRPLVPDVAGAGLGCVLPPSPPLPQQHWAGACPGMLVLGLWFKEGPLLGRGFVFHGQDLLMSVSKQCHRLAHNRRQLASTRRPPFPTPISFFLVPISYSQQGSFGLFGGGKGVHHALDLRPHICTSTTRACMPT